MLYEATTSAFLFYAEHLGDKERAARHEKIILELINICKEKIFEHVDNQFLLRNSDNEIVKSIFGSASTSKMISILKYIGKSSEDNETIKDLIEHASDDKIKFILKDVNVLGDNDQAKIDIYFKLVNYRSNILRLVEANEFSRNQNFIMVLRQHVLRKNISVLSFLNNYQENEERIDHFCGWLRSNEEKTQIINAVSCLDSTSLKKTGIDKYIFRNLAYIKYNFAADNSFASLPPTDEASAFKNTHV